MSLSLATRSDHLPVDFELYLPTSWTDDDARRLEARIPDEIVFKTKPELALEMLTRAHQDGLPLGVVLADAGYGSSSDFRLGVHRLGLSYSVGVSSTRRSSRCAKSSIAAARPSTCASSLPSSTRRGSFSVSRGAPARVGNSPLASRCARDHNVEQPTEGSISI